MRNISESEVRQIVRTALREGAAGMLYSHPDVDEDSTCSECGGGVYEGQCSNCGSNEYFSRGVPTLGRVKRMREKRS
jgi:hypothetical protein